MIPSKRVEASNSFSEFCLDQSEGISVLIAKLMEWLGAEIMLRTPVKQVQLFWVSKAIEKELAQLPDWPERVSSPAASAS